MLAFSADGRYLASAADGTGLAVNEPFVGNFDLMVSRIWIIETGKERCIFKDHNNWVTSIAFSLDDQYLATGSIDQTITIWNTKTGAVFQTIRRKTLISIISFDFTASCLRTETESIGLNMEHQSISPATSLTKDQCEDRLTANNTKNENDVGYALNLDACWITWNS